jgi:DNA-binding transcriptional regulator LsrR (DeoR family)
LTSSASPALPELLEEIASVIGRESALKLAALRGGQQISIPTSFRDDHWIVAAIGREAAQVLSQHFTSGRSRIAFELPRGPGSGLNAAALQRAQIVRDGLAQGLTSNKIAALAGISRRSVHRQIAKLRHERWRDSHRKDSSK